MIGNKKDLFKVRCSNCDTVLVALTQHEVCSSYHPIPPCEYCLKNEKDLSFYEGHFAGYNEAQKDFSSGSNYVKSLEAMMESMRRSNDLLREKFSRWRDEFYDVIEAEVLRREAEIEEKEVKDE
jgi:hypothetical protein